MPWPSPSPRWRRRWQAESVSEPRDGRVGAAAGLLAGARRAGARSASRSAAGSGTRWAGRPATASERRAAPVVPFHGEHQAGITTPAQDRLVFAAFDVTAADARELRACCGTGRRAIRLTAGQPVGPAGRAARAAGGHRRGAGPGRRPADGHRRVRSGAVLKDGATGSAWPPGARRCSPARRLPGDDAGAGAARRRHLRPGVRRGPAGDVPRGPQPGPHRPGRGRAALDPARLRPHGGDGADPGDAAQPAGLQGRDEQHPRRRRGGDAASFVWVGREEPQALDPRRHVRRHAADPDADRELGPRRARRPGADDRPAEGQRRADHRRRTSSTTWTCGHDADGRR